MNISFIVVDLTIPNLKFIEDNHDSGLLMSNVNFGLELMEVINRGGGSKFGKIITFFLQKAFGVCLVDPT